MEKRILELPISYEEKGKKIGEKSAMEQVALKMLKKDMDYESITELTNLIEDEIDEIRKQL